jgi:hypothetical protein
VVVVAVVVPVAVVVSVAGLMPGAIVVAHITVGPARRLVSGSG